MNEEGKKVFTPCPIVIFRRARKLSSYLVRAKLYSLEKSIRSFKCGKRRSQVCEDVYETDTFQSSGTNKEYKINHKFNYNEKCLIYLLTCQPYLKQYVGKTCDSFRLRWNNCIDNNRKFLKNETCIEEHLFEHFSSEGHCRFQDEV